MTRSKNKYVPDSQGSALPKALIAAIAFSCSTLVLAGNVASLLKTGNLFKAGTYTKRSASLANLTARDLRYASRAENVAGILEIAQKENRIGPIEMEQLSGPYSSLRNGDELLLRCLRHSNCQPDRFLRITHTSELHAEVVRRTPTLGDIQANHAVGAISENLMVRFHKESGWQALDGQVGRTGFDGLFVKRDKNDVVRELLIVESKSNESMLKSTNHGMQMSDEWVRKKIMNLRQKNPDDANLHQVEELIDQGAYRARIWNMRIENNQAKIELKSVHSKDGTVLLQDIDDAAESPPRIVDLAQPRTSFEKNFVTWYREELMGLGGAGPAH